MMPSPIRDEAKLEGGLPVLRTNGYLLHHIHLEGVALLKSPSSGSPGLFEANVASIEYGNQSYQAESLDAAKRISDISTIWQGSSAFPEPLQGLIREHEATVNSGATPPKTLRNLVSRIQEAFETAAESAGEEYSRHEDPVPFLLGFLGAPTTDDLTPPEQIPLDEVEIRARVVQRWKAWVRRRGQSSVRFRAEVREAYNWSCVICGSRFPKTVLNRRPGVDAAHILPWSDYDLDHVSNGLCLCRHHHWAFDEGLLRITYEHGNYFVVLAPNAESELSEHEFSLSSLKEFEGKIPSHRLPNIISERPRPEFLQRLYESMA
jgi:hypothetical protein